jgi:hypothetical protein
VTGPEATPRDETPSRNEMLFANPRAENAEDSAKLPMEGIVVKEPEQPAMSFLA